MTTLAVTSVSSHPCHASTCFRIGSKLRCIRSTPTEMQSMSENDFECLANTGVSLWKTTHQLCGVWAGLAQFNAGHRPAFTPEVVFWEDLGSARDDSARSSRSMNGGRKYRASDHSKLIRNRPLKNNAAWLLCRSVCRRS